MDWENCGRTLDVRLGAIPAMLAIVPRVVRGLNLQDMERIKAIIRAASPAVSQLNCETLAEWMQGLAPVLLIDVRSPEEFAVSHLRGAINRGNAAQIVQALEERKAARTVLYCAVGFRSSRLAQILSGRGVAGVMNLEGSMFQWANEGRPIYRDERPVQEVHPYGKRWAGLLKPDLVSKC